MQDEAREDKEAANIELFLVEAFFEAGIFVFEAEVFLFEGDDGGLQFTVTLVDSNGVTGGALQGDEFITRLLLGIL